MTSEDAGGAAPGLRFAEVITEIAEWLRGDEAEQIARDAERDDLPPEDALAHAIEARWQA